MTIQDSMGKRFGAIALAAVLGGSTVFGAVTPAFADQATGAVSVDASGTVAVTQTYTAYQIFNAESTDGSKLTKVTWGDGVDSAALLNDLVANSGEGKAFPAGTFTADMKADDVAAVLAKSDIFGSDNGVAASYTDTQKATQEFASIVAKHTTGDGTKLQRNGSVLTATVKSGYYFVKSSNPADGETESRFILQVTDTQGNGTGQIKFAPKASTVTSDKDIVDSDQEKGKDEGVDAGDYNIGDVITYDIKAKLPSNLSDYKTFFLTFEDVMQDSLTFLGTGTAAEPNQEVTVTIKQGGQSYTLKKTNAEGAAQYTVSFTKDGNADGSKKPATETENVLLAQYLEVDIPELVGGVEVDEQTDKLTVANDAEVIVTYKSQLNEKAKFGKTGNRNDFRVQFNRNPNKDKGGEREPGKTPWDSNIVFTYKLTNTKLDKDTEATLAGAEFVVKNADGNYAKQDDAGKFTWVDSQDAATKYISDTNGKFEIKGLDSGDYTLVETKAPNNYPLPANPNFSFSIVANINSDENTPDDGEQARLVELKFVDSKGNETTDTAKTGEFAQNIENSRTPELPHTGGMGTVAFTAVGVSIMAGAVVISVKRRANQQ